MKSSSSALSVRRVGHGIALGAIALTALAVVTPSVASAARVDVAGVTASSTYPPESGVSYDASKVIDGKASTSWVEGEEGSGLGSWIELDLGGDKDVDTVRFWAGMWYSADFWNRANRPKQIELEFADGSTHDCQLEDTQKAQDCSFKRKKTSKIKVKVKQVHSGSTWLDTGISEVQVLDSTSAKQAKVREVKASSIFPADADGSYEPTNTGDGIIDTMWCEGSKDGDGTGEWIEFVFDGSATVSSLSVINGIGGSLPQWMKANRAKGVTLTFSDGSTHKAELKNSFKLETVSFPAKSTSSVKITFDEVTKGKEFNDLCISEAYFSQ